MDDVSWVEVTFHEKQAPQGEGMALSEADTQHTSFGLAFGGEAQLKQAQNTSIATSLALDSLTVEKEEDKKAPESEKRREDKLELQVPGGQEQEQEQGPFEMTKKEQEAVFVMEPRTETGRELCQKLFGVTQGRTAPGEYVMGVRMDGAFKERATEEQIGNDLFRTCKGSKEFELDKRQRELGRVLHGFAHWAKRTEQWRRTGQELNYKALRLSMLTRDFMCDCSPSYLPGVSEHLINWNMIQVGSAALELVAEN
eukprot:m51a1_g14685 hypothetical protein (255) ;mRNA; f:90343-91788